MLKSRLDKTYSCFDGACNPEHPTHWLKQFIDNVELDIYLQKYTIFDNPFLDPEFVKQLCKEYEGTIYYDRLILGLWKRADGAIYKRFADNPESFRCEIVDEFKQLCKEYEGTIYYDRLILGLWKRADGAIYKRFADNPESFRCEIVDEFSPDSEYKQFRKEDITSIEIGLDFGGNQSGHSFVARGYTDNYRDVIALKSRRITAKDEKEDIDSNRLNELFCEFIREVIEQYSVCVKRGDYVQYCNVESVFWDNAETVEVIEQYSVCVKRGDYVQYCNVESVFWDNAETVLGNSIRNAVEKEFPWIAVKPAKKRPINDRIRCTVKLMGAGRFFITKDCESLQTAFSDAVWDKEAVGKDERLDDGSTDIDSLDAMGAGRFFITKDCESLQTAFSDAVWDKEAVGKDERLDDGSTDIDSLDAFEYTIERDMKYLIEEVEDV